MQRHPRGGSQRTPDPWWRTPRITSTPGISKAVPSQVIGTGPYVGLSNGLSSPVNHAGTRPLDVSVPRKGHAGRVRFSRLGTILWFARLDRRRGQFRFGIDFRDSQTAISGLSRLGIRSFVSTAFFAGRQARCARALSIGQRAPSPIICRSSVIEVSWDVRWLFQPSMGSPDLRK